jgi:Ser/Thr protein kinase RdoA (MazF antagonist)
VPSPRQVVLFRWVEGRLLGGDASAEQVRLVGELMARLHEHAAGFTLPPGLTRAADDWPGMGRWPAESVGALLSEAEHELCGQAAARVAAVIGAVSTAGDFGLIHSDMHFWNCLLHQGRLGAIDFDDCQIAPFSSDIAITLSYLDQRPDYAALREAFCRGYVAVRPLPAGYAAEVEAFMVERGLRMVRWVASWPSLDHFPFGRVVLADALRRCRRYLAEREAQ